MVSMCTWEPLGEAACCVRAFRSLAACAVAGSKADTAVWTTCAQACVIQVFMLTPTTPLAAPSHKVHFLLQLFLQTVREL